MTKSIGRGLHLLPGHRVKGEFEWLLPLLSLPVTVPWTYPMRCSFQKPRDRGRFLGAQAEILNLSSPLNISSTLPGTLSPGVEGQRIQAHSGGDAEGMTSRPPTFLPWLPLVWGQSCIPSKGNLTGPRVSILEWVGKLFLLSPDSI